jgi:hypothetical protein
MGLHPTLAAVRRNLPAVARSNGFSARITSAYRSHAKQAWLYDRYIRGLQQYPVAPPGTSDHERGLALDVVSTDTRKLVNLLTSIGLSWAGPVDPVHFSLVSRPPVGSRRTNDLPAANPIRRESFWESFEKSSRKIVKLTSYIPNPLGLAATIADWIL